MELTGKKVYSIEIRGVNAYKGSALSLMRGTEWSGQSEIEESGEGDKPHVDKGGEGKESRYYLWMSVVDSPLIDLLTNWLDHC